MKPIETKQCDCGTTIRATRDRCRACVAFSRREKRIVFDTPDVVQIVVNSEPLYPFPASFSGRRRNTTTPGGPTG